MKLLITGGTGFIGSHLAQSALGDNHDVSIMGLAELPEEQRNVELLREMGARIYQGSVTDQNLCSQAMEGVTHVYHLAVAMREGGESDEYFERVNLSGTRHLLDAAVQGEVKRFIYCSTIGIFGHRFDGVANEDSPLLPGNIYERTKVAAEKLVLGFHDDQDLPVVILRPADVYGPRDYRLLKLFKAINKGKFPLFGDGSGRRHMVYIDDVVSAFELACEKEEAIGQSLIIAGPETCNLRELIDEIQQATGQSNFGFQLPLKPMQLLSAIVEDAFKVVKLNPPIYRRRMDFFSSNCAFDTSKARETLDWAPKVCVKDGVKSTLAAYRNEGLL